MNDNSIVNFEETQENREDASYRVRETKARVKTKKVVD